MEFVGGISDVIIRVSRPLTSSWIYHALGFKSAVKGQAAVPRQRRPELPYLLLRMAAVHEFAEGMYCQIQIWELLRTESGSISKVRIGSVKVGRAEQTRQRSE